MYYKIENNYPIISPIELEGFIAYTEGQEPQELKDAFAYQEQLEFAEKEAQMAKKLRDEAMLLGFDYNGVQISVTKEDGDGMVQVKSSFEMGLTETVIHFSNGTKLPMTAQEFPTFAAIFVAERNKFFV